MLNSLSVPFFVAAALGLLTLFAAMRWLLESLSAHAERIMGEVTKTDWRTLPMSLGPLLGLALVGQFSLEAVMEFAPR